MRLAFDGGVHPPSRSPLPAAIRWRSAAAIFAALLCTASLLRAQDADPVQVELMAAKVIRDDRGKERLQPGEEAKPGDLLQYTATYHNGSEAGVSGLLATLPIPPGLEYVAGTASPAKGVLASTDGASFAPMPLLRDVKKEDGTIEKQPVPLSEYRALRWTIPSLAAGRKVAVSARAGVVVTKPR